MFFRCISINSDRIRVVFSPNVIVFEYALNVPSTILSSRREGSELTLGHFNPKLRFTHLDYFSRETVYRPNAYSKMMKIREDATWIELKLVELFAKNMVA